MPEPLSDEDAKLVTLARSARARSGSDAVAAAAVRDTTGRTYVATSVALPSLTLTALQAAVAAAVSSGVESLEAAAVVTTDDADVRGAVAVSELAGPNCPIVYANPAGAVTRIVSAGS